MPEMPILDWSRRLQAELFKHLASLGWYATEMLQPVQGIQPSDQLIRQIAAALYARQFFRPVGTEDYCRLLVDRGKNRYTAKGAERIVGTYQEMGQEFDLEHPLPENSPMFCLGRPGFTLKTHAPQAGPCHNNFQDLQDWDFPDEPTGRCLYSWVPRLVPGSTGQTVAGQRALLAQIGQKRNLPAHHLQGFGKVGPLVGLILKHQEMTGEHVPRNGLIVRTDSCLADGRRLRLCWFGGALGCDSWQFRGERDGSRGVFALGVEELKL